MKDLIVAGLVSIASLYLINAAAERSEESSEGVTKESEMYLDEIRAACESEAAGLADAQDYIERCIKDMQQNFAGTQD